MRPKVGRIGVFDVMVGSVFMLMALAGTGVLLLQLMASNMSKHKQPGIFFICIKLKDKKR